MRRKSKKVICGDLEIGGNAPISIQSMTNTDTRNVNETIEQIKRLESAGCHLVRVAVPDLEAAEAISKIKKRVSIPVAADIHFDFRLAIKAMECGVDKIRINPGNIGDSRRVEQIIEKAKKRQVPIRIGINSGSLEKEIINKYKGVTSEGLVESALKNIQLVENMGFSDIVVSIKSSGVVMNYKAHKLIANKMAYPLHIGITESGSKNSGLLKSAVGIGALLLEGIGDTVRVSLTGDPVQEIYAAKEILKATEIIQEGINVISCPTCGRCCVDLERISSRIEAQIKDINKNMTVAIMGCEVNGPGEAREADIGIAYGKNKVLLFKGGEIVATLKKDEAEEALIKEVLNF
jgi:(E)-4-hydroxy-3-methylbut-2-enyl-diphosphate synthase